MDCDVGNLLCCLNSDLNLTSKNISSEELQNLTRECVQELANTLYELPTETIEGVVLAKLPDPKTSIPREKPCPKPKMETKWDKFAKLKGITNKKKGRKVWSDDRKEWVPRFGFKSENNQKDWLLEVPTNADPYEDQFEKKAKVKKEAVAKNELQRLRNIARNSKGKVTGIGMMPTSKAEDKRDINERLIAVKKSTASMGDFDVKVKDENKIKMLKKRKFDSNFRSADVEKNKNIELFDKIKAKIPIVDKEKAAKVEQVAKETKRAAKRKAESSDHPSHRDKKPKTPKKQRGTSKHSMQKKRK